MQIMAGWRSKAARDLVKAVVRSGGRVERVGRGRLKVTGPTGEVTIHEPSDEPRRDLRRSSAAKLIGEKTGLNLNDR